MRFTTLTVAVLAATSSAHPIVHERSLISSIISSISSSISSTVSSLLPSVTSIVSSVTSDWQVTGLSSSVVEARLQNALTKIATLQGTDVNALASLVGNTACSNAASARQCWGSGYNIAKDFDQAWPTTGVTRYYTLTVSNITLAPDGYAREVLAVNGQYPGPTIYANWGDTISITVKNALKNNGTSMHWHGLRQYNTNTMDGVPGVTECPIAPGQSFTYTFHATQFGTSWYHSHFSSQYGDGVVGPIVINGPSTANYDVDLGPLPVTDWYYTPVQELGAITAHTFAAPPVPNNGLINGTMTSTHGGSYYKTTITSGKKYRIRLINTSVANHFMVSLDSHPFTVIAADFVPIVPYVTNTIFLGIGQRYDVIITANQTVGNYWFRADAQTCAGDNANNGNIKSIFSYTGAKSGNPTSSAWTYTQRCTDETSLVPFWDTYVNPSPLTAANAQTVDVEVANDIDTDGTQIVAWNVNASALKVDWKDPLLSYVYTDNTSYPSSENLIALPTEGKWYYWIIQQVLGTAIFSVPHPVHLHGHDFFILGTGTGTFDIASDAAGLNYTNPTRRDTAMLPSGGWLVIAFETDNPGAWIMHCHIAWHASEGLAVNFLESASTISKITPQTSQYSNQCANWASFYKTSLYKQDDSGI